MQKGLSKSFLLWHESEEGHEPHVMGSVLGNMAPVRIKKGGSGAALELATQHDVSRWSAKKRLINTCLTKEIMMMMRMMRMLRWICFRILYSGWCSRNNIYMALIGLGSWCQEGRGRTQNLDKRSHREEERKIKGQEERITSVTRWLN